MGVTDKQRKDGLLMHRIELIKRLEIFDSLLLDEMMANKVLNEQQSEAIKGRGEGLKDNFKANIKLIDDVLARCDLEKYNIFLNLLKERQEDLANKLRGEKEKTGEVLAGSKEMEETMDRQSPKGKQDAATTRAPAAAAAAKHEGMPIILSDAPMEVPYTDTVNKGKYEELQRKAETDENFMYKMDLWTGKSRGMALIINVQYKEQCERHGTDDDRDMLKNLWGDFMHFDVMTRNDADGLTAQGIMNHVKYFSDHPNLIKSQAIVVCLLAHGTDRPDGNQKILVPKEDPKQKRTHETHGQEGYILGTDGILVPLIEIYSLFSNNNKKIEQRVPRLFFIQACRGGKCDYGVPYRRVTDSSSTQVTVTDQSVTDAIKQLPTFTDCFWGLATPPAHLAYRHEKTGSPYITYLVTRLRKHANEMDLGAIHNLVNQDVAEEDFSEDGKVTKTISESKSRLTKAYLYFFP